jgi:2-C-methyl-D-erythritol 4-phosphate cytidylyltransferase
VRWAAVVVAAGSGTRFGAPKQFWDLAGLPMAGWSIETFAGMPEVAAVVVATEPACLDRMRELCDRIAADRDVRIVAGGATRQQSVYRALEAVPANCDGVFVHDGARPLIRAEDVRAGMRMVRPGRGSLLASPVVDTVKVIDESGRIVQTLDRERLRAAQTPQFACSDDLRRAHRHALENALEATDDAMLLEAIGLDVFAVVASDENFKVTVPADASRAATVLSERRRSCD